jgi:hypothetical protein
MAKLQITKQIVSRIFTTFPATLGFVSFALCEEPLNLVIAQIHRVLCGLAGQFFAALPTLVLALFQTICAAGHQQVFTGAQVVVDTCVLVHMLLRVG